MSLPLPSQSDCTIAVIGLGYVGLPLAVEFSRTKTSVSTGLALNRKVIGFDINQSRIDELRLFKDVTRETTPEDIKECTNLEFTSDPILLATADVFIITVPTPIDSARQPNLSPLAKASSSVGVILKHRSENNPHSLPIIIYESTVYPGATEEVCIPLLEKNSGLVYNQHFYCGYSPERINPGDAERRLPNICKVTSGSTPKAADWICDFYSSIISAGIYKASAIKVAEAAKVIENTQRDLNIALINELAMIFAELKIDTLDVLEAASTKWNFLSFKPGLVGGHCIGVDPYYLTHKAEQVGFHPQVILSGRRINDGMSKWLVERLIIKMVQNNISIKSSKVLLMGFTFKENCPDIRNTKIVDVVSALRKFGVEPIIVDPQIDINEVKTNYNLEASNSIPTQLKFDAIMVLVAHGQFIDLNENLWLELLNKDGVIFDLKGIVPRSLNPCRI